MRSDQIAALMVQGMQQQATGNTDIGYHIGTVTAWDDMTGLNSVSVNGVNFDNLSVISPGPAISINTGDTVVIMRFQTQYFILGKVAAPGASAALRSVSEFLTNADSTTSTTFTDLATVGPTVTTYIGQAGKALVLISSSLDTTPGQGGSMSFAISGASSQAAQAFRSARFFSNEAGARVTVDRTIQVIDLTPGQTTFTAKYRSDVGGSVAFYNRSLAVIPF